MTNCFQRLLSIKFQLAPLQLGVAVSAYYANRLKGNFITVSGREQFRLKLVEGFSAVTGMAALAGKLAGRDVDRNPRHQSYLYEYTLVSSSYLGFP